MTDREKLTFERFEALCDLLAEQGTIPTDWREALKSVDSPERGREARDRARDGRGPPSWAGRGRGDSTEVPPSDGGDGQS